MNRNQTKFAHLIAFTLWCWLALITGAAQAAGFEVTYYHNDLLGSPVAATNEDGELLWRKSYQPYGSEIESAPDGEGAEEEFVGYTGHRLDKEIGLVYAGARYYDPVIGRFMGVDPVGFVEDNPMSFNRYAYANNNPYKYVDPDGRYADLAIEAVSLSIGAHSFSQNIQTGNFGSAAIDGLGLIFDGVAAIIPGVPGAAGIGIRAAREGGEAAAKGGGKGLETRGVRPGPGERTIQGQVDAATQAGNPTIQRGGQDLVRLRSSGHGQSGATATPQNVFRTNPKTGERFGPQAGPDRAVTPRDIRELHKAQTGQGTSTIRTRSGRR